MRRRRPDAKPPPETADPYETGRVQAFMGWLRGRVETPLGRLALQWSRAYFDASRNSGCAATIYSALSVLPAALAAAAVLHPTGDDANLFAERLVDHLKLTGTTADLVQGTFGTASANALAATISVIIGFLIWGIGIGQIYQDVYARAWGLKFGAIADQARFAIFFFVLSTVVAVAIVSAARLRSAGLLVLVPVWMIVCTAFWLWVPRFLMHKQVSLRALLPGALVGAVVIGGTSATSPLWIAAPMNANGKAFGAFGVVLTLLGYLFVLITLTLVCAVFSPVWAGWRESERQLREEQAPGGTRPGVVA